MSRDIPYMAKVLVKRVKSDPKVDMKHHWKLITLLIGANDFCSDICYYDTPEVVPKLHEKHLLSALRTIRDNLPRTMVNVVSAPGKYISPNIIYTSNDMALLHSECYTDEIPFEREIFKP